VFLLFVAQAQSELVGQWAKEAAQKLSDDHFGRCAKILFGLAPRRIADKAIQRLYAGDIAGYEGLTQKPDRKAGKMTKSAITTMAGECLGDILRTFFKECAAANPHTTRD